MKNFIRLFIGLTVLSIAMASCSNDDTEEIYDEVLSNTIWIQSKSDSGSSIIVPGGSVADSYFQFITDYLDYTVLGTEDRNDTIWDQKELVHYYILEFKNETCELKDMNLSKGTYCLEHNLVEKRLYPNQTVSRYYYPNVVIELTLNNDTAILKYPYNGYIDDNNNLVDYQIGEERYLFKQMQEEIKIYYGSSDDYPYVKEDTKRYNMTFTRNGMNIELNGDIHLAGVISPEGDKIELNRIGTLYKSTTTGL